MRILILGGTGMLGHRLWLQLGKVEDVWVTTRSSRLLPDWPEFDKERAIEGIQATNLEDIARAIALVQPDLVINCVGLIKQLPLASDPTHAIQINSLLPHRLALLCDVRKCRLIHISTDCVFSGKKGKYTEEDFSDAIDLYGKTKFLGEVTYPHTVTLRTSIIGHELHGRYGLLEWFLSQTRRVKGYTNAIYSGLTTDELARVIINHVLYNSELSGLYHVSSTPVSKYDLLCLVKRILKRDIAIEPDSDFVCDRSLDSSRFRMRSGYAPPTWERMIEELAETSPRYV